MKTRFADSDETDGVFCAWCFPRGLREQSSEVLHRTTSHGICEFHQWVTIWQFYLEQYYVDNTVDRVRRA
jgi:hypothetical protein